MCGIIGCFSRENCYEKVYAALVRLEYRGYDSAGIALLAADGTLSVRKKKGGASAVAGPPLPGETGIGHTRWATHGVPCDRNAHPHRCGKFALVHNGIVENDAALRESLRAQGETFVSDTDSEVIVRLIARAYTGDFFAAVAAACAQIEGPYAIAVLCTDFPGEIIGARRGSPLVAGAGGGALYLCSDIPALYGTAEYICPVQDGEFVRIRKGEICFCGASGNELCKTFTRLADAGVSALPRGKSCMESEIGQIPRALADTLAMLREEDFLPCARAMRRAGRVFAVACGTAYHAALAFRDVLEAEAKIPVLCRPASEFCCRAPLVQAGDLVIAVSQSGETADTLAAVRLARSCGAYVLAVTNVAHSSLASEADRTLVMRAGPEIAVAATKSYNCQLLCLYAIAAQICFYKFARMPAYYAALGELPDAAQRAFACFPAMDGLAERLQGARGMFFLGRDADVATAREGALKVKEIAYLFAEGYPASELKHGTLALVEEGFPVAVLSTRRALVRKCENAVAEASARGAFTILFSQQEEALAQSRARFCCRLPAVCEPLMPVVSVIPLQYLACRLYLLRGFDPDRPRNLAKSVTVE